MNSESPTILPHGWSATTLGEIAEPSVEQAKPLGDGAFLYIDISSIDRTTKRIVEPKLLPVSEAPSRARQRLQPGDVLISMTRPNLNAVTIVPPEMIRAIGSTGFYVLRSLHALPKWLFYLVQTNAFVEAMSGLVLGVLYPAVRPKDISSYPTWLAPVQEQRRIVSQIEKQLTGLDAGVSALKRVLANLKRYRAAVLKVACEGQLVPIEAELARKEGRTYETGEQQLSRILKERRAEWEADQLANMQASGKPPKNDDWKEKYQEPTPPNTSNLPPLPKGWIWSNLDQLKLFSIYGPRFSSDHYADEGTVVLRTTDISESGKVDLTQAPRLRLSVGDIEKYKLVPGDLVFTRTGATIGKTAIFNDDVEAIPGAYLIHFRLAAPTSVAWYVYRFFQSVLGQRGLLAGRMGIGQPNLNAPTIEAIPIPLPPAAEQNRILVAVDTQLAVAEKERSQIFESCQRAQRLRQSILKSAFDGKLVPQDPDEEPASALLERIRAQRNAAPGPKVPAPSAPRENGGCRSRVESECHGRHFPGLPRTTNRSEY